MNDAPDFTKSPLPSGSGIDATLRQVVGAEAAVGPGIAAKDVGAAQHWSEHAQRWARVGPPLKPTAEDRRAFEAAADQVSNREEMTALVLGVTPEIATMRWPQGARLVALDHAEGMVANIWPRQDVSVPATAIVADWRDMPLDAGSVAVAVGDGSYNAVDSTASQDRVSHELIRVLRRGGQFALRAYVRPAKAETPSQVIDDLNRDRIGSFNAFKLRFLMATPVASDGSTALADTWERWAEAEIDRARLSARTGWPPAVIDTIDAFRGKSVRFVFLSLADTRKQLDPFFVETGIATKSYELGDRCPTLFMSPRH